MEIAFSGPRQLSPKEEQEIYKDLSFFIFSQDANWHVGDASGLDDFIRRAAAHYGKKLTVYEREGNQRWQFAARSKRMIDAIADRRDTWLYAFPNQLCPPECKPCSNPNGSGSGTWLTIAYAKHKNVQIYLFPLIANRYGDRTWLPNWLTASTPTAIEEAPQQLSLF